MSDITSTLFGPHAAALALRDQRLRVLATNVANADTPNYKAQDLDFSATLRAAAGNADAFAPAATNAAHARATPLPEATRVFRIPLQPSMDGNTVDGDYENAAFARAAVEYRTSLTFVENRMRSLMTAITGE